MEFVNWSGSLKFTPSFNISPGNDEEVISLVLRAANEGKKLRVAGAGHSSSPLVKTEDYLISLEKYKALLSTDPENHTAVLQAGLTIHEAGMAFRVVFAGWPFAKVSAPRAISGQPVKQIIKRDLRTELRGQSGKAICALPVAEIAPDTDDHPRELAQTLHHGLA